MYIFVLVFDCFSGYGLQLLPNSLFLLDTDSFIYPTTSCRPCHPAFLQGFHRFGECVCFSWLSTRILCLSKSVDFLSFLYMYVGVFLVLFVCLCVCLLCLGVHRQTNRHRREISEILPTHTRACTTVARDHSDTLGFVLAPHTHIHARTHKYVSLFACLSEHT
jgi:hypothetical protein